MFWDTLGLEGGISREQDCSDFMRPVLEQYKFELQGKKYYKLVTEEIKFENVFGSLGCFDYDIDNMKVNIVWCL